MADPFDMFGSDSEEDFGNGVVLNEAVMIAKSLVEKANATKEETSAPTSSSTACNDDDNTNYIDLAYLTPLEISWPSPIYMGEIGLFDQLPFGGGRSMCALKRLPPGTTIMIENPVMKWSDDQLGKKLDLFSVRCLLLHPNAGNIVHWIEDFHPTKKVVDDGSDEGDSQQQVSKMIKELESQHSKSEVMELVQFAETKGIILSYLDIFRILLAIRYNGLESGIYLFAAMLNHSCHPNCAKLFPRGNQSYSELVTTREVAAGENLTISYVPNIMSHASRRQYLYNHHRFDILANLKGSDLKMELVHGNFPKSSIDHIDTESPTQRIERSLQELEKMHAELVSIVSENELVRPDIWETVKALEQSTLELCSESQRQLNNDRHLLLIPCFLIHLEVCNLVQQAPGLFGHIQLGVLSRQVHSLHSLIPLQVHLLGSDHFDLGRSNLDYSNAIGELLSRSPKHLFKLRLPGLDTFDRWSKTEVFSRKEHLRIKNLYSRGAEVLLAK